MIQNPIKIDQKPNKYLILVLFRTTPNRLKYTQHWRGAKSIGFETSQQQKAKP